MVVLTLVQQYNVGEKPTVILFTLILIAIQSHQPQQNRVVIIYDGSAIEPYKNRRLGQQ